MPPTPVFRLDVFRLLIPLLAVSCGLTVWSHLDHSRARHGEIGSPQSASALRAVKNPASSPARADTPADENTRPNPAGLVAAEAPRLSPRKDLALSAVQPRESAEASHPVRPAGSRQPETASSRANASSVPATPGRPHARVRSGAAAPIPALLAPDLSSLPLSPEQSTDIAVLADQLLDLIPATPDATEKAPDEVAAEITKAARETEQRYRFLYGDYALAELRRLAHAQLAPPASMP